MISQKKHERFLYILLCLYTVLVLFFMLLLNGFFVKPKAFSNDNTYTLNGTLSMIGGNSYNTSQLRCTSTGRTKTIFYSDPEFEELMNENYTANDTDSVSLFRFADTYHMGGTLSQDIVNVDDHGMGSTCWNYIGYVTMGTNSPIWQYFHNKGVDFPVDNIRPWSVYMAHTYNHDPDKIASISLDSDIEYVDTPQALYDYMVNSDDSVVKVGDPENPQLPEDDSLPVPQSLTLDLKNNENAYPPFLSGSWSNPNSLLSSYDASQVQIEVQYKPNFQYYKKIFDIKLDTGQANEWISVNTATIDNFKKWTIVLNNSNNLPPNGDGVFVRSGSDDISLVASQHGISNYSNHVESLNGTKWRCRYIVGNKTSLWVVYGLKSINKFGRPSLSGDDITFENASGDSISAEDVNYTNSSYTEQDYDSMSFLGKIRYDIDNLFTSLKSFFSPQDQGNGFYAFFGRVFEQFPIFWALFVLGLVVAILLRIFGR